MRTELIPSICLLIISICHLKYTYTTFMCTVGSKVLNILGISLLIMVSLIMQNIWNNYYFGYGGKCFQLSHSLTHGTNVVFGILCYMFHYSSAAQWSSIFVARIWSSKALCWIFLKRTSNLVGNGFELVVSSLPFLLESTWNWVISLFLLRWLKKPLLL